VTTNGLLKSEVKCNMRKKIKANNATLTKIFGFAADELLTTLRMYCILNTALKVYVQNTTSSFYSKFHAPEYNTAGRT